MLLVMSYNAQIIFSIILCVQGRCLPSLPSNQRNSQFAACAFVAAATSADISPLRSGAFLGHFIFQRSIDLGAGASEDEPKGLQCH